MTKRLLYIIKILLKIILVPILFLLTLFEVIFHCIKWLITGKKFPENPLWWNILIW